MIGGMFPRGLKVGFSRFVAGWAVATWAGYGPGNFLWFCDLGNLALVVALPPALFLLPVFAAYAVVHLVSHAAFVRLFPPAWRVSRPPRAAPSGER